MATRIQNRRATATQWSAANPILADGEVGYIKGTQTIKIGDGVTAWNSLPAFTVTKALDADKLDGIDSTGFLQVNQKATDSERLDGFDSAQGAATANTVVIRDSAGRVFVATPTDPAHATTKGYVDGRPSSTVDIFTASGVFTKPAGAKSIMVIAISSGGGGGYYYGGAGGGRASAMFAAAGLPATIPVTVSPGGAGINSRQGSETAAQAGGPTSFGTYLVVTGAGIAASGNNLGGNLTRAPVGFEGKGGDAGAVDSAMGAGAGASMNTTTNGTRAGGYSGALAGGAASTAGGSRSGTGLAGSGGGAGASAGISGGAGGIPGGGGGGGGDGAQNLSSGGSGGRGELFVISYF